MIFRENTQRVTHKLGAQEQESYVSVPAQFYAGVEARVEWIPGEGIESDMLFRVEDEIHHLIYEPYCDLILKMNLKMPYQLYKKHCAFFL